MEIFEYLCELSPFISPSGQEGEIGKYIAAKCRELGFETSRDALGSIISRREVDGGKKVMLCAHMDTIGLMATFIEPSGHVRFAQIGGLNRRDILYAPVVFQNGTRGVIARDDKPKETDLRLSDLFIDIGASSENEAKELVGVGDTAVFWGKPFVSGGRAFSPYMDNRVGIAVLLAVMDRLKKAKNELYFVFSSQEEVGLRGARTAAFGVNPDYAIAVDVTDTGDNPDPRPKMAVRLGAGPAIKIMDRSVICHPEVVSALEKCAEDNGISFQREVLEAGGTDAGAIHISREGVKTGGVSIPARYIHTPSECIDLDDSQGAAELITALLERGL